MIIVGVSIFFTGCIESRFNKSESNAAYFNDFDIFNLQGNELLNSDQMKKGFSSYVEVRYSAGRPVYIKYFYPKRTVQFEFVDSILMAGKHVYIYSTGNLLGGKSGKQKDYSLRKVENKYLVYSALSDTLFVKNYDVIDRSFESYHYTVNVYIKSFNGIKKQYLISQETKDDKKLSNKEIYEDWLHKLRESALKDSTMKMERLPPY